ncbi:MAG: arginine deiminase family protein [Gammaproteobacteria bacterium]
MANDHTILASSFATEPFIEQVLPEIRFQGANAFAISDNNIITFGSNADHTLKELASTDMTVHSMRAPEISRWHGGPHCMTLPLERDRMEK